MRDSKHAVTMQSEAAIVAISACLLGENVRYDGSNKLNNYIIGHVQGNLEIVAVCPEMAIGLGVPRPPVRLVMVDGSIRCVGVRDKSLDVTERLRHFARQFLHNHPELCGFILTSQSPSCGVNSTKLYDHNAVLIHSDANGLFAEAIMYHAPAIAIINDDKLESMQSRVEFFTKVYALSRLKQALQSTDPKAALHSLHECYCPLLYALSASMTSALDQLLNTGMHGSVEELPNVYKDIYCRILSLTINREHLGESVLALIYRQNDIHNADFLDHIHQAVMSYINAQSEWPEMLEMLAKLMDRSGYKAQPDLDWLVPLAILG